MIEVTGSTNASLLSAAHPLLCDWAKDKGLSIEVIHVRKDGMGDESVVALAFNRRGRAVTNAVRANRNERDQARKQRDVMAAQSGIAA